MERSRSRARDFLLYPPPFSIAPKWPGREGFTSLGRSCGPNWPHAVLIGCIVFFSWFKVDDVVAENITLDPHSQAELSSPSFRTEYIQIFAPSPDEKSHILVAAGDQM
jgi:hypothetical protein